MPPLTNEEREYLKSLADKFHDRVTAPGRDSIEKGTNQKPLTQAEQRAQQTLSDKFNDRVKSPDREIPRSGPAITDKFNDRVTSPGRETVEKSPTPAHSPAAGLQGGPRFNGPGGDEVRASTFADKQKDLNNAEQGRHDEAGDGWNKGPSDMPPDERAELEALVYKFNDRVTEPATLDYANDRDRGI